MLLDQDELKPCSAPLLSYCSICSSVFPVNLSKRCIVGLFMKNSKSIDKICQKEVIPNSVLPMAHYLFDGVWIISSQKLLKFSVVCPNYTKMIGTKPPLETITLEMACSGSNDYMTLMPYYHRESKHELSETYLSVLHINNKTQFNLSQPFTDRLPNFT